MNFIVFTAKHGESSGDNIYGLSFVIFGKHSNRMKCACGFIRSYMNEPCQKSFASLKLIQLMIVNG